MKPSTMRRWKWAACLAIAAVIAAGVAILMLGGERNLLTVATRIRGEDCKDMPCTAITNREYIWQEMPDYVTASNVPVWYRRNLDTGCLQTRELEMCPRGSHVGVDTSPDGRWILCYSYGGDDRPAYVVNSSTGKATGWLPHGDIYHYPILWMSDSLHWISIGTVPHGYLTVYCAEQPGRPVRVPFPDYRSAIWMDFETSGDRLFAVDRKDRNTIPPDNGAKITEYKIGTKVELVAAHRPEPSVIAAMMGFKTSPKGNRIAWTRYGQLQDPIRRILHRFLPGITSPVRNTLSLWTSDLDGRDLREIGYIPMTGGNDGGVAVEWLPNGKELSLNWNGSLYIVPE